MIDTDKDEGHSTGWKRKTNHSTYNIINDDGHKVASIGVWADVWKDKSNKDSQLIADAPLLLQEVKRLREQVECSKDGHEWELDDYLDGDPNKPVRIVETCAACGLTREREEE